MDPFYCVRVNIWNFIFLNWRGKIIAVMYAASNRYLLILKWSRDITTMVDLLVLNLLMYYMRRFQFHIVFDKIQLFISQLHLHLPLKTHFINFLLLWVSFCFLTSSFIKIDIAYQQTNSFYTLVNCTNLIKKSEFNCGLKIPWFIPCRVLRLLFYSFL